MLLDAKFWSERTTISIQAIQPIFSIFWSSKKCIAFILPGKTLGVFVSLRTFDCTISLSKYLHITHNHSSNKFSSDFDSVSGYSFNIVMITFYRNSGLKFWSFREASTELSANPDLCRSEIALICSIESIIELDLHYL